MELAGFGYGDFFFLGVNDEDSAGEFLHVFDAAQVLFQFFQFAAHQDNFLLRVLRSRAFRKHRFQFFQTGHTGLDGAEIGEHAAEPAFIDIEHIAAQRFFLNGILSLLLRAYEEDRLAACRDFTQESVCFFNFLYSLLQVNDVDAVAFGENEPRHFRIPAAGLMTEMNACFE